MKLSELLSAIHTLGYKAAPFEADQQEAAYHRSMKNYLYRLGVAGLATMQVMMLAVALYLEVFGNLEPEFKNYFRWVSLDLCDTCIALFCSAVLHQCMAQY